MHPYPGNWVATVVRSCIMPGLPMHLVQELNVGTVGIPDSDTHLKGPVPPS